MKVYFIFNHLSNMHALFFQNQIFLQLLFVSLIHDAYFYVKLRYFDTDVSTNFMLCEIFCLRKKWKAIVKIWSFMM